MGFSLGRGYGNWRKVARAYRKSRDGYGLVLRAQEEAEGNVEEGIGKMEMMEGRDFIKQARRNVHEVGKSIDEEQR